MGNFVHKVFIFILLASMGQVMRAARYDRATNEKNAIRESCLSTADLISLCYYQLIAYCNIILIVIVDTIESSYNTIACLKILDHTLNWHRLDDGVMGGQSETALSPSTCKDELDFSGQINTDGGGFCSVRALIEGGLPPDTAAIKVCYTGDGKTYKVTLSDGSKSAFGPSRRSPSWQKDLPTKDGVEDTAIIPLDSLKQLRLFYCRPRVNTSFSHQPTSQLWHPGSFASSSN